MLPGEADTASLPFQMEVGNELEAQLNMHLTTQGPLKRIQTPPTTYSRISHMGLVVNNLPANSGDMKHRFDP